jgi:hypothetical protein
MTAQGLGRMIYELGYDEAKHQIVGKKIKGVVLHGDHTVLTFILEDGGKCIYVATGDCCSRSWIEHITVPDDIKGALVTKVKEFTGQEIGGSKHREDVTVSYQTSFVTDKGEIIVEYRNSSNGYYGGWLEGGKIEGG